MKQWNNSSINIKDCPCLEIINGFVRFSLFIMHSQIGKENVKSTKAKAEMCTADLYVFSFCFEKALTLISHIISIMQNKGKKHLLLIQKLWAFPKEKL